MFYHNMPFDDLFHIVFADDGSVNACGREACMEMIERLGKEFGNLETGHLKLPDAFIAAKQL